MGKRGVRGLVVVAHPDDETIWMGGTILQNKDWNWTVLSLSRKDDLDRMPKFKKVCRNLNAVPIISDLDDEKLDPLSVDKVAGKIKDVLPEYEYDYVYTHGFNGEYGHIRHKEIHKAVKKLIKTGEIKCKKMFSFSYVLSDRRVPEIPELKIPVPEQKADEYVELCEDNFKKKVELVKDIYGFGGNSFEVLSCHRVETFKEH